MLKKICYPLSLLLPLTAVLFCSRFDESTGLGSKIIQDVDPSLTDINKNFRTATLKVDSAFSIPDKNDTRYGEHPGIIAGNINKTLTVGTKDGTTASGYLRYTFDSLTWKTFKLSDTSSFAIDSVSMQISIHFMKSKLPSSISVYTSTESEKYKRTRPDQSKLVATLVRENDSSDYYSGIITDTSFDDAIVAAFSKYKEKSTGTSVYYFSFFADDTCNYVHLKNPTMKIFSKKDKDTIKAYISPDYLNYVAVEEDIESLNCKPISAFASSRTAVFKVNLNPLWETMDSTGLNEILSAAFKITPKTFVNKDTSGVVQEDDIRIVYYISDTLFNNNQKFLEKPLKALQKTSTSNGTTTLEDTLVLKNLEDLLQQLSKRKPSTGYLYIQFHYDTFFWKEVLWNNPKFEAILTTLE